MAGADDEMTSAFEFSSQTLLRCPLSIVDLDGGRTVQYPSTVGGVAAEDAVACWHMQNSTHGP